MESTQTRVGIRWMIRRDAAAVLACGLAGWTAERLLKHQRRPHTIGMVAEVDGKVVGWMLYRIGRADGTGGEWLRLVAFAVHPDHRHQGIASALLAKVASKLHTHRKPVAVVTVPESAVPAQLALRAEGGSVRECIAPGSGPRTAIGSRGKTGRGFPGWV